MVEQVQLRRGTAAQIAAFTGAAGELAVDTTNNRLVLQDGATAGGWTFTAAAGIIFFVARGINFNLTNTDTAIPLVLPNGCTRFSLNAAFILAATQTLTTATAGLFTNTGGGGVAIASSQAITVNASADATNNNMQALTLNNVNTTSYALASLPNTPNLYFRVGTPQGVAAFADVVLMIRPVP